MRKSCLTAVKILVIGTMALLADHRSAWALESKVKVQIASKSAGKSATKSTMKSSMKSYQRPAPKKEEVSKTVLLQTSPISSIIRKHINLVTLFYVSNDFAIGPKLTIRPSSPVSGYELGVRSRVTLTKSEQGTDLGLRAGLHYLNLTRDEASKYHEGGMFTPYLEAHSEVGQYSGFKPEAAVSVLFELTSDVQTNLEVAGGLELYQDALYFTGTTPNRLMPSIEVNFGIKL